MATTTYDFIRGIPKAELHLHIEGTFEPELMFVISKRNNIRLKYNSIEELRNAYNFNNLQEFLDIYYEGASVLVTEKDFYDLTWSYIERIYKENVYHTEIFFDPQMHTSRGIQFKTVITGIHNALVDAKEKLGISSNLILCFLRHLEADSAMETLEEAIPFKDWIKAVGLDSSEVGHPPSKFKEVFDKARGLHFLTVAHAGEEGPAEYVREALDYLKISRIDHGNNSLQDMQLVGELVENKIPLTICPLSNLKLKVVHDLKDHPLKQMLQAGMMATVNSDDPAYFGGYINENYIAVSEALSLSKEDIYRLARNSFEASFLPEQQKELLINKLDEYMELNK